MIFVLKTKYQKDKTELEKKIKKTALTAVKNKILNK